jgi:hypothetical protein
VTRSYFFAKPANSFVIALATILYCLRASAPAVSAAELTPPAVAAFERYTRLTEARLDADVAQGAFLGIDGRSDAARRDVYARVWRGDVILERLETRNGRLPIDVPGGMIHHWRGTVFLPRVTLAQALAMARDYDHYHDFFPDIMRRSKLVSRSGDNSQIAQRFVVKRILTGVIDIESAVAYASAGPGRETVRAHSTRVAEVADVDTPREHELPVGRDNGYLWRVNSYCHFEEKDGGTYLQSEWVSLSRAVPFGLGWMVDPIVSSLSRDTLQQTLLATRRVLIEAPRSGSEGVGRATAQHRTRMP